MVSDDSSSSKSYWSVTISCETLMSSSSSCRGLLSWSSLTCSEIHLLRSLTIDSRSSRQCHKSKFLIDTQWHRLKDRKLMCLLSAKRLRRCASRLSRQRNPNQQRRAMLCEASVQEKRTFTELWSKFKRRKRLRSVLSKQEQKLTSRSDRMKDNPCPFHQRRLRIGPASEGIQRMNWRNGRRTRLGPCFERWSSQEKKESAKTI